MLPIPDENICIAKMLSQNYPNMTLKGLHLALERKLPIHNSLLLPTGGHDPNPASPFTVQALPHPTSPAKFMSPSSR